MAHPCQCLLYCYRPVDSVPQVFIAASGASMHAFNVSNGDYLSSWPPVNDIVSFHNKQDYVSSSNADNIENDNRIGDSYPPSKRRRRSPRAVISTESSSAEIVVGGSDGANDPYSNPIIKLVATSKGRHVIAVTSDDKCMRVFELSENGLLLQISERAMPKKPCAVTLTPDDLIILCADKFGDVYSLPLLGKSRESNPANGQTIDNTGEKSSKTTAKKFIPSATSLTVHTKRNLDALKQQQNVTCKMQEKKSLDFDHQLILGHVSLLTDIICASTSVNASVQREYILTADRDEHIRVSRGIPQAHVIEGYCLGHTNFISKLCLIPSKPKLLISGGGDDFLLLWDWLTGKIKQKIMLRGVVEAFKKTFVLEASLRDPEYIERNAIVPESIDNLKITISKIQVLEVQGNSTKDSNTEIVVACEGIPALFLFSFDEGDEIQFREAYPTEGNVIDIVTLQDRNSVIYSMDNVHQPFSTNESDGDTTQIPMIEAIHFLRGAHRWEEDLNLDDDLMPNLALYAKIRPMQPQQSMAKGKSLKELLYCLEILRKRGAESDESLNFAAGHGEPE